MICRMLSMSEILTDERARDLVCWADFIEVNPTTNHNQSAFCLAVNKRPRENLS